MTIATLGFFCSALVVLVLGALFHHETQRGARFGEYARAHADVLVLKMIHAMHKMFWYIGRDFTKQVVHYSFHTVLRAVLSLITRVEKGIRNIMRVNKTLAQYSERESSTRNKLEELALHKAEVALTEKEKKLYKDRSLKGM